jgi:class 3 adenylate cyclase
MFGLNRLSIQSKLIVLLLAVSLSSIAVTAWIGFKSAKTSLAKVERDKLHGMRVAKTSTLKAMLKALRDEVISMSDSQNTIDGLIAFRDTFHQLKDQALSDEQLETLKAFYKDQFLPALDMNIDGTPLLEQYLPENPVSRFLQYHYIAANPFPVGEKNGLAIAPGDPSTYGDAHEKLHKPFSRAVNIFGFEDIMLIDYETLTVIYSYQKTPEFGTSLENGPYANTLLAEKVREVKKSKARDDFMIADFEPFRPSHGLPMGFALSPVFDGATMIGVLALQFPIDSFNEILTGNFNWRDEGLGESGETYLVGPDLTMRSRSRFMYENAEAFIESLKKSNVPTRDVEQIKRQGNVICVLPVESESAQNALRGMSGIMVTPDYRGVPVLSAYGPLELDSLRWAVLTEIDLAEANAPIRAFGRQVIVAATATSLLVTLLALLFASVLTRPLRELSDSARRLGAGETGVRVTVHSADEFGELGRMFNQMAENIHTQREQLEAQVHENQELLLNILPASAVDQRRSGDEKASRQFADVSVLFAEIIGMEEISRETGESKVMSMLGDLIEAFDEACEKYGIEKVRTIGASYLAVCGLSVSRPDHTRRVIQFAQELVRILGVFNREHKSALTISIGINSGPVVGGVVGRRKFLYDLWGDTVTIARKLAGETSGAIRVTGPVRERVGDQFTFSGPNRIDTGGKNEMDVWQITA